MDTEAAKKWGWQHTHKTPRKQNNIRSGDTVWQQTEITGFTCSTNRQHRKI